MQTTTHTTEMTLLTSDKVKLKAKSTQWDKEENFLRQSDHWKSHRPGYAEHNIQVHRAQQAKFRRSTDTASLDTLNWPQARTRWRRLSAGSRWDPDDLSDHGATRRSWATEAAGKFSSTPDTSNSWAQQEVTRELHKMQKWMTHAPVQVRLRRQAELTEKAVALYVVIHAQSSYFVNTQRSWKWKTNIRRAGGGVPVVAQQKQTWPVSMKTWVQSEPAQWVKDPVLPQAVV